MGESVNNQHFLRLNISGMEIPFANCHELVVREWMFDLLPTISIKYVGGQEWGSILALQDQLEISAEFGSTPTEKRDAAISGVFHGRAWNVNTSQERIDIDLAGHLAVSNSLIPAMFKSYSGMTSSEVLERLGKDFGVKNGSKVSKTYDNQNWLQCGQTNHRFIQSVLERSWTSEGDALFAWVNRFKQFEIRSLSDIISSAEEPRKFVYSPENVADDIEIEDYTPYAGFVWKDVHGVYNLNQGYGSALYSFDFEKFESTIMKPQSVNVLSPFYSAHKDNAGKAVEVRYEECPPSAHPNYFAAQLNRERVIKTLTSSYGAIELRPQPDLKCGEVIDLKTGSLLQGESSKMTSIWDGKYLVGGLIHHHRRDYGSKSYAILFRGGTDVGLGDEGSRITNLKNAT